MNPRTRDALTLALIALLVVCIVVVLVLAAFLLSGNQQLISGLVESTAKGELFGVGFTVGGPFAMWAVATIILLQIRKHVPLRSTKLFLHFPESDTERSPPSQPAHFRRAKCSYSIFSNGQKVVADKEATVQTEPNVGPYIHVQAMEIENAEIQVMLEYQNQEWFSDSYSPRKGSVNLR